MVDVYRIALPLGRDPSAARLTECERARAASYPSAAARRTFTWGRVALRELLARHVGVAVGAIAFDRTCHRCGEPHGKPRIAGAEHGPEFSFTRAGSLAVLAVGRTALGVDAEPLTGTRDLRRLAATVLTPAERAAESMLDERSLLARWCAKEALLKAAGIGLALEPRSFALTCPPAVLGGDWTVRSLELGGRFVGALAACVPTELRDHGPLDADRCWRS